MTSDVYSLLVEYNMEAWPLTGNRDSNNHHNLCYKWEESWPGPGASQWPSYFRQQALSRATWCKLDTKYPVTPVFLIQNVQYASLLLLNFEMFIKQDFWLRLELKVSQLTMCVCLSICLSGTITNLSSMRTSSNQLAVI